MDALIEIGSEVTLGSVVYIGSTLCTGIVGGALMMDTATALENMLLLAFPCFFVVLGYWRRSWLAYIVAIVATIAIMPSIDSSLGAYILPPLFTLIIGLAIKMLYETATGKADV